MATDRTLPEGAMVGTIETAEGLRAEILGRRVVLLTAPMRSSAGTTVAIACMFYTERDGFPLLDLRADDLEIERVEVPKSDPVPHTRALPGIIYFSDSSKNIRVGFLPDSNARNYEEPLGVVVAPGQKTGQGLACSAR